MPVDIPSLRGKCDYEVETAIKRLAGAVNQLEGAVSPAALAQIRQDIATVRAEADALTQRFDLLYSACQKAGIV